MKNKLTKILSFLLVLVLSSGLIACGGNEKTPTGNKPDGTSPKPGINFPDYNKEIDDTTRNIFVDDDATDGGDGSVDKPFKTLVEARDYVRKIKASETKDIKIYIRDGYYFQEETFVLTPEDSGKDGQHIYYINYPGERPVISGGLKVTGWRFVNGIYETTISTDLPIRNLFVNGERKVRARSEDHPEGMTLTADCIEINKDSPFKNMERWENKKDIELTAKNSWKFYRIGVDKIEDGKIYCDPIPWANTKATGNFGVVQGAISWIENAKELLDKENEWYYNRLTGKIYYFPQADEKLRSSEVIVPVTERLIELQGSYDNNIKGIVFEGLSFKYDAYSQVEKTGYIEHQSGVVQSGTGWFDMYKTPGSVHVTGAKDVTFKNNVFEGLGINGLYISEGCKDVKVKSNYFNDISGAGVSVANIMGGDPRIPDNPNLYYDHHPDDERKITERIEVSDNLIENIGAEYYSTPGIFVGYARNISLLNNTIRDVPYSAISMGWGWGYPDDNATSVCKDNVISGNNIYRCMLVMMDGGAIYTLGEMPGTVIKNNYLGAQKKDYAYIYLDNGSAGITISKNVITSKWGDDYGRCSYWGFVSQLFPEPPALLAHDNTVSDNWYSSGLSLFKWKTDNNNVQTNNVSVENDQWPDEAKEIMKNSGSSLLK